MEFVEGYRPGYLGRIAEMHGVYYAKTWGSGYEFEGIVATELYEFLQNYDPAKDLLLTVHENGLMIGSIAIQSSPEGARLRWVLLDEAHHGRGIGKELLRRALAFARAAGYTHAFLWTVEGLPQSMRMYERAGFQVTQRFPDARYGLPNVNVRMDMDLV